MKMKILLLWMTYQGLSVAAAPSINTMPPSISHFSCAGRQMGLYADIKTNCRAYHTCDDHGNHFMNYCPDNTAFRQDAMICDHAYLVDCQVNVDSVNQQTKFGQDDSHDTPPPSFAEPRGEGTNVRGFARSFRINPDSKSSSSTKHPTFVLNSSVFLKDRAVSKEQKIASPRAPVRDNDFSMTKIEQKDYSQNPFLAAYTQTTSSDEAVFAKPTVSLSQELQPPIERSTASEEVIKFQNEDYSFLIPPPIRNDNVHLFNDSFATPKFDNLKSNSRVSVTSAEFFSDKNSNSSKKDLIETVTFFPRTKTVLEMMKARSLGQTSDFSFSKPSKLLVPPLFKSDVSAFARSNFNFRTDDYPYVETLRSIQNNKATTSTTPSPLRIHVTDASIFAVPTKSLAPAKELEKDPYYPKPPTSTETYYTSRLQSDKPRKPQFTTTRRPFNSNAKFEIPAVLPDLNSLEDLLDRRKFFFIPPIKS